MENKRTCPCEDQSCIDEMHMVSIDVRLWVCDECEAVWRTSESVERGAAVGTLEDVVEALAPGVGRDGIEVVRPD